MSSIEVSLVTSNSTTASASSGNSLTKPLRSAPSPSLTSALQSQLSSSSVSETVPVPKHETSSTSKQILGEPNNDTANKDSISLSTTFKKLFDNFDYELIHEAILNRQMIECEYTTVLWRIFLHCLPRSSQQWDEILDSSRRHYEKLVEQYSIDPYKMNDMNIKVDNSTQNHPLSQDKNCSWTQYFSDEALKATITTDVRRTYPDIQFFRSPRIIDLQLRILFIHSRHHQQMAPYRQGMHEILGIIVYTIHLESLKINQYDEANELMKKLYDPQYLEHDSYALFEKIIDHLRQFYSFATNNIHTVNANGLQQIPFQRLNEKQVPVNDTVTRMNSIFERLRHYDRFLYGKLEEYNIEPTVYGIRWLRLLFGREVPFESIPNLWTVIFCFDEHFSFVDYFFIALLIELGQIIGKQTDLEHNSYLASLMKQNVITDVEPVIRKALTLTGRQLKIQPERQNSKQNDRENAVPAKRLQRIPIQPPSHPRLNRPIIADAQKSTSASDITAPINANHSLKHSSSTNSPFSSSSETTKSSPGIHAPQAEMDLWAGKSVRQQYDENIQLQKSCAEYMNKFIERLQKHICDLKASNEDELLIQLTGLKQIANILDGRYPFDSDSLQTFVDFQSRKTTSQINTSDTTESS